MKKLVRTTAHIVLTALLTAGLAGCGRTECETLRESCNRCADSQTRAYCLDWARRLDGENNVCAASFEQGGTYSTSATFPACR